MSAPSASPRTGNSGLTRAERTRSALAPESFLLDERGMVERMALARRFARLVAYIDPAGREDGDWAPFLAGDPCFLHAEIALDADAAPATPAQLRQAVERLDGWYRELEAQNDVQLARAPDAVFVTLHAQIAGQLGPTLHALQAGPAGAWTDGAGPPALAPVWGAHPAGTGAPTLAQACARFAEAGRRLAACARAALEHGLAQDRHPPHAGLLLAYLRLLDLAQDDLNRFTGRHLDYYFRDTLRMREREAEPGEATIVLALAPSCPALDLPAGTRFRAGQDGAGKTIVYASTAAAQLNRARVAALSTLYLERDGGGVVRALHAAPVADSADGMGAPLADPALGWPAFGTAGTPALPGCAIAAPVLALAQGTRTVTLTLAMEEGADALARAYLDAGAASLAAAFSLDLSGAAGWFAPAAGFTLAPGAGTEQWQLAFTLAPGEPALAAGPALLPALASPWPMLRLCLDPGATPYAYSYLAALRLRSVAITVRVEGLSTLQLATGAGPVAPAQPFAAFGNAPLPGQFLQVAHPELSLKDVSRATLRLRWMNLPMVDPAVPPPASSAGTPARPYTFADYYAGYAPYAFDDAAFTVAAAVYADGAWTSLASVSAADGTAAAAPLALFPDAAGGASVFALDLAPLRWSYAQAVASLARPAPPLARGALRLTLAAPAYGFGSAIFPGLFAQQAIAAVKAEVAPARRGVLARLRTWIRRLFGRRPRPAPGPVVLPNPPYVPMAGAVSLDYTASESPPLVAAEGMPAQFWQLTPFGQVVNRDPAPPLFPSENDDGHLYLGIAGAAGGQTLHLHVELRERGDAVVALGQDGQPADTRAVRWRWMSANAWHEVPPSWVVSRTMDFGRSGSVALRLPAQLDVGNTALPGGLFWLEARVARAPERYPRVVAILPQAIVVRRDLDDGAAGAPHPLPVGSVNAPLMPLPGVKSASQPYPGQGGASAETAEDFRVRVSERLRHKQRASQARDYEQLVLAAAPALWQAKCIGPNDSAGFDPAWRVAPGDLVLAVAADGGAEPQLAAPMARADLAALATLLRSLCSPAVRTLQVRNVAWESLCVAVDVRYRPGADAAACDAALNAALCALLAPPPPYPARLAIGCGILQVDQVAALVRAQDYVAQAGPVTVIQRFLDGASGPTPLTWREGQVGRSRTPWSVLVPAPRHAIGALAPDAGAAPASQAPTVPAPVSVPAPLPVYTLSIAHPSAESA